MAGDHGNFVIYSGLLLVCCVLLLVAVEGYGGKHPESPAAALHSYVRTRAVAYSREDVIECMLYYVDGLRETKDSRGRNVYVLNPPSRDGCIDEQEIDVAKLAYLSPFERKVSWVQPNSKIMSNCDFDMESEDKNGQPHCISRQDMTLSNKTCLNTPDKLEKMDTYICRRARSKFRL